MRRDRFCVVPDRSHKAVASLGDGLDVVTADLCITQHLPQVEDMPGQIAFLDKDTRPDFVQQLFLFDDVARPLDEDEKGFEILWREDDGLAIAEQNPLDGVEAIRTEPV